MVLRNKSFCPEGSYIQVAAITLVLSLLGLVALHEIMEVMGVWGKDAWHYPLWFYILGALVLLAAWATAHYAVCQHKKNMYLSMLANAVEYSGEAISIIDTQGCIQYINPAFTTLTGYSVDEALHQPVFELLDSAAHSGEQAMPTRLGQKQCWQGRLVNKRKDGSCFPAAVSISPVKNHQGKIAYYIVIQNDDTQNQQAHEQELRDAKIKALATAVGGIAHEFNNILTGIMGNAFLVKIKEEDEALKAKLESIEQLGEKAAGMVQQMLVYVGHDLRSHKHVYCDIRPVVQDCVETFVKAQGFHCQLQAWHEPLMAYIDPHAIAEAMMHLLGNAQNAVAGLDAPDVQVQTLCMAAEALPDQPYEDVSHYVCIRVLDNGAGIPDDIRDAVFEPFFTTKDVGKGVGLGLSTVYGIAREHHGFVKLEDSRSGCSFLLCVPLKARSFRKC